MTFLYVCIIIFIFTPFLPAIGNPHWFFRTADFVRLQSIAIEIILFILLFLFGVPFTLFEWILVAGLILALVYQLAKVYQYTRLHPTEDDKSKSDGVISILGANVLQTNTKYDLLIAEVGRLEPDILLVMETNKAWEHALSVLEESYPFQVKIPQENFYGMHVYAKKELINVTVQYQIEEDVPSVFFSYQINQQTQVYMACLHPAPPSPTENNTSIERDAELMLTGKKIRSIEMPTVIYGDMNDVVWSRTSLLFRKMTGMIDPRVGRGFFSTYYAQYWFMRFPLDHLFHTKDLFVDRMERTRNFGSDHFGMYYEIHLKKEEMNLEKPKLAAEDNEEIAEIISRVEE